MDKQILLDRLHVQFEQFITLREKLEDKEVIALRREIFNQFLEVGFPNTKMEDWKYVNMSHFLSDEMYLFTGNDGTIAPKEEITEQVKSIGDNTLVFLNGFYSEDLSQMCGGCIEVDQSGFFLRGIEEKNDGFTLLSKAFAVEEVKMTLQGTTEGYPVKLLFCTYGTGRPFITQPRVTIVSSKESEAVVIERYKHFGDQKCLTNLSINVKLDTFSTLKHYRIQGFSSNMTNVHNLEIIQHEKSRYEAVTVTSGNGIVRNTHNVALQEADSEAALYGSYSLEEKGFVDNHTLIHHQSSHTVSRQVYKGTLDSKAHGVFNGKVVVEKDLMDINSEQSNKTILLSENARMDTKPELQIFSNDVICSHGAALGHLDEETLFFMRARGIGEQKAKYLLSIGFIQEIIQRIDNEHVREELLEQMKTRFLLE